MSVCYTVFVRKKIINKNNMGYLDKNLKTSQEYLQEIRRHAGVDINGNSINHDDRPVEYTTREMTDQEIIADKSKY